MGEKQKVVVTRRLIAEAQNLLDTVPDLDLVQWPSEQV
jgi:glyoxylate/hydroxypyruvate reductase